MEVRRSFLFVLSESFGVIKCELSLEEELPMLKVSIYTTRSNIKKNNSFKVAVANRIKNWVLYSSVCCIQGTVYIDRNRANRAMVGATVKVTNLPTTIFEFNKSKI